MPFMTFSLPQFKVEFLKLCDTYDSQLQTLHHIMQQCNDNNKAIGDNEWKDIRQQYEEMHVTSNQIEVDLIDKLHQLLDDHGCNDAQYVALSALNQALMMINTTKSSFYAMYSAQMNVSIDTFKSIQQNMQLSPDKKTNQLNQIMNNTIQAVVSIISCELGVLSSQYPQMIGQFYSILVQTECLQYSTLEQQWIFNNYKYLYNDNKPKTMIRQSVPSLKG